MQTCAEFSLWNPPGVKKSAQTRPIGSGQVKKSTGLGHFAILTRVLLLWQFCLYKYMFLSDAARRAVIFFVIVVKKEET